MAAPEPVYAVIDERSFDALVRGREAVLTARWRGQPVAIHLLLCDIGFTRMLRLIDQAIDDQDPHA